VHDKCLKEDGLKQLNQSRRISGAVFILDVALQTQFSFSSKFTINLGSMPKTSPHVLMSVGKLTTRSLKKVFGSVV